MPAPQHQHHHQHALPDLRAAITKTIEAFQESANWRNMESLCDSVEDALQVYEETLAEREKRRHVTYSRHIKRPDTEEDEFVFAAANEWLGAALTYGKPHVVKAVMQFYALGAEDHSVKLIIVQHFKAAIITCFTLKPQNYSRSTSETDYVSTARHKNAATCLEQVLVGLRHFCDSLNHTFRIEHHTHHDDGVTHQDDGATHHDDGATHQSRRAAIKTRCQTVIKKVGLRRRKPGIADQSARPGTETWQTMRQDILKLVEDHKYSPCALVIQEGQLEEKSELAKIRDALKAEA